MDTTVQFAASYDRTPEGWIKFPEDSDLRKELFHPSCMGHPAKANIYMYSSIIDYVSKPGERVMDIMSGTGTIMIAALRERKVTCIELESFYHPWLDYAKASILKAMPQPEGNIMILHGDCRKFLPLPTNHIIFSPPYSDIMVRKKAPTAESDKYLAGSYNTTIQHYSASQGNVGLLGRFLYNQEMERIYKLCYMSLPVNGTLTIILKDYTEQGKRVFISDWMLKSCVRAGFYIIARFKRHSPGTGYLKLWKSKGLQVVEDEDILIVERR